MTTSKCVLPYSWGLEQTPSTAERRLTPSRTLLVEGTSKAQMTNKIRVGVLIDSHLIPEWSYVMLDQIRTGQFAEVVLVVKNDSHANGKHRSTRGATFKTRTLVLRALATIEGLLDNSRPDAFAQKDIRQLFPRIPLIAVNPVREGDADALVAEDIAIISSFKVQVLIKLGFRALTGAVLTCTPYGVWALRHGDFDNSQSQPDGLWEVMERRPETYSVLEILHEDPEPNDILFESYSQTDPLSVSRSRNSYYWKSSTFVPRKLKDLFVLGEERFRSRIAQLNQHFEHAPRRIQPTPHLSILICSTVKHYARRVLRKLKAAFFFNQWILLYSITPHTPFSPSFGAFKKIVPPKDRFWADPFFIHAHDRYYVFLEEQFYRDNKAHISVLTIDKDGRYSNPETIIEKPYHLSYPFVMCYNDDYYMIPETAENRTIELYKCSDFPKKWELNKILVSDIRAFDATIFHKDGMWWLFANVCENEGSSSSDELFLFYSCDLISSDWTPHPMNPIVSDVKSSRPAGSMFLLDGRIYRPSQNSGQRYGYGMKLNQVVTLSESDYEESSILDIKPTWDRRIIACHTINFGHGLTVLDAMLRRSRWAR